MWSWLVFFAAFGGLIYFSVKLYRMRRNGQ
jgi:hypothetical protein